MKKIVSALEGPVYALAAHGEVYFAAGEAGLFRSDDGGHGWQFCYDTLQTDIAPVTLSVALAPADGAGLQVFAGAPGGVLRSADGGANWFVAGLGTPPPVPAALAVSPQFAQDGIVFAGMLEDGIFCSTDRGVYWSSWNFGLLDLNVLCLALSPDFAQDETVYAGTETGLFRSANGGRAWRETAFPSDQAPVLSLVALAGGVLLAGTENGLFRSDDSGDHWQRLPGLAGVVNTIIPAVDFPRSGGLLVACETALRRSLDGGQSWQDWQPGLHFEGGIAAVCAPNGLEGSLLVAPASGGVLRLTG
jgi:photosystem II stability/assembly factor-like uncharacterized protein